MGYYVKFGGAERKRRVGCRKNIKWWYKFGL